MLSRTGKGDGVAGRAVVTLSAVEDRDMILSSEIVEGWRTELPKRVRLIHKLLDGRFHVYTSPDLKGLHVAADSHAEAQRKALAVVHAIALELGHPAPVVTFGEVAEAA